MAKDAGHDPKKAAVKTVQKLKSKVAEKAGAHPAATTVPAKGSLKVDEAKHNTVVKAGTPGPKEVVKMAATQAKKEGHDPEKAAKLALNKITQEAAKAGIKPAPKNIVAATAKMAKDAGHDPKKAAVKTAHTLKKAVDHAAAHATTAAATTPAAHAATATTK